MSIAAGADSRTIYTIGHSDHSIQDFAGLLGTYGVDVVLDVRSAPYSRWLPQFNREPLRGALGMSGIRYGFLGKELGGRSGDETCYEEGRIIYERVSKTSGFRAGIERVRKGSADHSIALMCSEKEPLDCHRTILVSRELASAGEDIVHILADGRAESHEAAMERLLGQLGLSEPDLLRARDEVTHEACAIQGARIAYARAEAREEARGDAVPEERMGV